MGVALQIVDVYKSYGRSPAALDGVSFSLPEGECHALLGPNGAGKTSLMRCVCGLTVPDRGEIRLLGRRLPRRGGRQAIGMVPQDIALYIDLTAAENLTAFGRYHGLRGATLRDRVSWALEWSGLEAQRDSPVGSFSGGMQRRINIACGVLHRPRVVLLDEPTVGVDPQSRQRIFTMLRSLRADGAAILISTHHLDEAEDQCDRILIMDRGRIAATGTMSDLVRRTVGATRHVRVRVVEPIQAIVDGWGCDGDNQHLISRIDDVGEQLPPLLNRLRGAGYSVRDVEVQSPTLHHVFLHLTGHQLRD